MPRPRASGPTIALLVWTLLSTLAPPPSGAASREVDWLAGYVRIDTRNPPGGETVAAEYLAGLLHAEGIATELLVPPSGRASLLARLPATVPDAPAIVLLHHLDVVPPGEGWSSAPFSGETRDGALWGRGTIDCKGLGIAQLAAFLDAATLPVRRSTLLYLAVAGEESGGGEGAGWILAHHRDRLGVVEGVLNEGGANRAVGDRTLVWGIEIAQKRPLWLELSASGRPGHGAMANPESAAHQLIRALDRVLAAPRPWRVTAAARAHFAAAAKVDPQAARILARLDALEGLQIRPEGLPAIDALFTDTLQVTMLEGADQVNVVAPRASARLDIRLLPDSDETAFLAALAERLGPGIEIRVLLDAPPTASSPIDSRLFRALSTELGSRAPVVPVFIPAITDSRYFRALGIPAYGFSPFALDGTLLARVHGPDERIPLAAFDRGVAIYRQLVRDLLRSDAP